jgi:hypothetical protein
MPQNLTPIMNTPNQTQVDTKPPYVAYRTFSNFIKSLRESGIPNRIDRSVPALAGQSGATQSFLLATLRFLGFTTQDGTPTSALKELVAHPVNEKVIFEKTARENYKFIFNDAFKVETATEAELGEKFKEKDLSGQTIRKAVSFFVALCGAGGIKLSPHFPQTRGQGNGTSTRRYKKRIKTDDENSQPSAPPQAVAGIEDKLLDKFPKFDPTWPTELQTKWFESFEKFMASVKRGDTEK